VELELGDRMGIARSGIEIESIRPPPGGRAPGWQAGLLVARRSEKEASETAGLDEPVRRIHF
jgi:hypothetical protein